MTQSGIVPATFRLVAQWSSSFTETNHLQLFGK